MMPTRQGSLRLFRFAGIDLFVHWSWFLVAIFEFSFRRGWYSSPVWNALEYLSLFLIVMLHEFGHALACRQVGGQANQIVLWPLGGVAYVAPPPRPGATLWSIAAGPLVNVVLLPVLSVAWFLGTFLNMGPAAADLKVFLETLWFINLLLLLFNLIPIYPLDGGQILQSILWFFIGRAKSLLVATVIGLIGATGFLLVALWLQHIWFGVMAVFILFNCWRGFQMARALIKVESIPRRPGFACVNCNAAPPLGNFWICSQCRKPFDTFETGATCPHCATYYGVSQCMDCGGSRPINDWMSASPR